MSPKTKKVIKIVGNSIFYLFIGLILVFSIINIRVGNKGDDYPSIFGRGYLTVVSDSMSKKYELDGIDTTYFEVGDLIIVKRLDDNEKKNLKIGDVITFYDYDPEVQGLNTHRIVGINGNTYYTQGNKEIAALKQFDQDNLAQNAKDLNTGAITYQTVNSEDVKGLFVRVDNKTGSLISWISDTSLSGGFLYVVVLPTFLFLIYQIVAVILNIIALKDNKVKTLVTENDALEKAKKEEEIRAQIRAELEEEMKKEKK